MPGTGKRKDDGRPWGTPKRGVRLDDELWASAKIKAAARGESVSAVIERALRRYVAAPLGRKRDAS